MNDPRPDLQYDTQEWDWLLKRAFEINQDLAYILHGFRCSGLRLLKSNAGYVMRPDFEQKSSLWKNQAEYDKDKSQWLLKYTKEIIELLNKLGG